MHTFSLHDALPIYYGDHFYILTNKDNATNFKLMKTPIDQTEKNNWIDVIPHRENVLLENFEIFNNWLVLEERKDALTQINIRSWDDKINYYLPFKIGRASCRERV